MNIMGNPDEARVSSPRATAADDPFLTSGCVLGSWSVLKLLGEGGMGRVYLAEHTAIGRRVAVKVLKRALARSPELVERFFAEAHAVNRIRHPGIVEVTDCFIDDGGTPCLVMELLEGRTLAEEMSAMRINPTRVAAIGADVAIALDAAHKAGVIHRDMKPDNLFLVDKDGVTTVKVLDFGVAKLMDPMPNSTVHTVAGSIMGTPDYMAPEQLAGKPVDARADIYALGASLYHACTGRPPFQASNFGDLVVMHMTKPPPPPSRFANLPPVLEQVLLAMLEKDPNRRPQTMGDVALLLRSAQKLGGGLPHLEPAGEGTRALLATSTRARAGTAPFVAAQPGQPTGAFSIAPIELVAKLGPVGPPPPMPPPRGASPSQAPLALLPPPPGMRTEADERAWVLPLHQHTPSGTLLLGSSDAPEVTDDVEPRPISPWLKDQLSADELDALPRAAPVWAWAAVAGLLFVAVGGGVWGVASQDSNKDVVVSTGYKPVAAPDHAAMSETWTAPLEAELVVPEAPTLASTTKLARPLATLDADSVRTRTDATVVPAVREPVAERLVVKKTSKLNKAPSKKPKKAPKAISAMAQRRAVLDPFAKDPR